MKFNLSLESIKYVKISYRDIDGDPCTVKAAIKKLDSREVLACAKFEDDIEILTPQEVVLSIVCNEGLYKTKTLLRKADSDAPYIFFSLETPQGLEYTQNREYFRVNVEYECNYKVLKNSELKTIPCKTVNISANGVSIEVPTLTISEEEPELEIKINNKVVKTKIRYIRSERCGSKYLISFTYVNISESDRDVISQACIKRQLEQKRNSIS